MKTELIETFEMLLERGIIKPETTTILIPKSNGLCGECQTSAVSSNYAFLTDSESIENLKKLFPPSAA